MTDPDVRQGLQDEFRERYGNRIDRLANSPIEEGDSQFWRSTFLFSDALWYGALYQSFEMALPLLESARRGFTIAVDRGQFSAPSEQLSPQGTGYATFEAQFGLFVCGNLVERREPPVLLDHLEAGIRAVSELITPELLEGYTSPTYDRSDIEALSAYGLTFLATCAVMRLWKGRIDDAAIRIATRLPVVKRLEEIRAAVGAIAVNGFEDAAAFHSFRKEYGRIIDLHQYHAACIGGLMMEQVYALSLVRRRGDLAEALIGMFDSE